ncbi:MAG: four helix bundle protein [Puniceicoccales bacterium]|jgi:four helix bundle protein|nr:four helix bundle protein [Puniceicoccales bacterium]
MTSNTESYRALHAWQKAMDLVVGVYQLCRKFPSEELFVLSAQLRRATLSVPSNIAEGYGRGSLVDYLRFLKIAAGSLYETETQLELAQRLGFINASEFAAIQKQVQETKRLLAALIRSLEQKHRIQSASPNPLSLIPHP